MRALALPPLAALLLLARPGLGAPQPTHPRLTIRELAEQVNQVARQAKNADDNLRLVETQYADRTEPSQAEIAARRYSDGEIQYLLGDFRTASVLFYDLVSDKEFRSSERYPDALYYLADSLYNQGNLIGARVYLKQLLAREGPHYREGLGRYLEVAGKLNDFEGIEAYMARARTLAGGQLPDDLSYVYGKWIFKRPDWKKEERLARADEVFGRLAGSDKSPYRLQSQYFLAVAEVERGKLAEAARRFEAVAKEHAATERELQVKEMANLSLGRVLYEQGQYDAAIDRYQEIPRESDYFPDSLYEIAWAKVKKQDFEGAKAAVELLQLVAPDSTLKPEADILEAHLLLKLHKYQDATDTYNQVINTYAPVRDELDALLKVNRDPVAYFDNLLQRSERTLDVNSLLPAVAVKWATTQAEVAQAVRMVGDIEGGRHGLKDSEEIAQHILQALSERGLQAFPALQEGFTRADAVDSAITQSDGSLVRIESALVEDVLTPAEQHELATLRDSVAGLQRRFEMLPKSEQELKDRKDRLQGRVDALDREAFKLGYELQSMSAMLTAIRKWVEDTRAERHNTPEDEKLFFERVMREEQSVAALQGELDAYRATLQTERAKADTAVGGEDAIRAEMAAVLSREHTLIAVAESRLSPEAAQVTRAAHEIRDTLEGLRSRVTAAKTKLLAQVTRHREDVRGRVAQEQTLLTGYGREVDTVSTDARHLVGRIAFDSFRRVRQQFYNLVLKADVGLVDVAFTRKQDQTLEIQRVSQAKDRDLKALDEEFKEVLKDVD